MSMLDERFEESVALLHKARDKNGKELSMKSLVISDTAGWRRHDFVAPSDLVDLRSVSKVATCLTIGALIERRLEIYGEPLTLETKVWPFFKSVNGLGAPSADPNWNDVRLKHLLSNTIGHREGFLFRKDIGDRDMNTLLEYVFDMPVEFAPGTHFSYSNVGPFLVSALVQLATGRPLHEWADETVFGPLRFGGHTWKQYGQFDAGCSGLCVTIEDMHKLGELLRDRGKFSGRSIVSADWCARMHSRFTESPSRYEPHRALPKQSYGFGLWVCPNDAYYCDGTDGQYLIVLPYSGIVISTTGSQPDMKPISECFRNFIYGLSRITLE
jgi:CubicO group peptidase (beta-lactamase class C family)